MPKPTDGPVRVRSKATGLEYTVARVWSSDQEVIDKRAVDANGRHLPAKYQDDLLTPAAPPSPRVSTPVSTPVTPPRAPTAPPSTRPAPHTTEESK